MRLANKLPATETPVPALANMFFDGLTGQIKNEMDIRFGYVPPSVPHVGGLAGELNRVMEVRDVAVRAEGAMRLRSGIVRDALNGHSSY